MSDSSPGAIRADDRGGHGSSRNSRSASSTARQFLASAVGGGTHIGRNVTAICSEYFDMWSVSCGNVSTKLRFGAVMVGDRRSGLGSAAVATAHPLEYVMRRTH